MIPHLMMKKQIQREQEEIQRLLGGLLASTWLNRNSNPADLTPESEPESTTQCPEIMTDREIVNYLLRAGTALLCSTP